MLACELYVAFAPGIAGYAEPGLKEINASSVAEEPGVNSVRDPECSVSG